MQDGHDEASGSSSEVDDTTETKVLVISSSDCTSVPESNVSENELLLLDRGIDRCVSVVVSGIFIFCENKIIYQSNTTFFYYAVTFTRAT